MGPISATWQKLKQQQQQQQQQQHNRQSHQQSRPPKSSNNGKTQSQSKPPPRTAPDFSDGHQPEWTTNPKTYHPNLPPAPPPKVRVEDQEQPAPRLPPRPGSSGPLSPNDFGQDDDYTKPGPASPPPPPLPKKEVDAAPNEGPPLLSYSMVSPPPSQSPGLGQASSSSNDFEITTDTPPPALPPVPAKIPLLEINDRPHEAFNAETRQSSFDDYKDETTADFTASVQSPYQPAPIFYSSQSSSPSESKTQGDSPGEVTSPAKEVVVKTVEKVVERDPYEDLDPFYKSSLARFVAMLRREMAAETDEEKYRLFANCVVKETRLRKALYEVSDFIAPRPAAGVNKRSPRRTSQNHFAEHGQETGQPEPNETKEETSGTEEEEQDASDTEAKKGPPGAGANASPAGFESPSMAKSDDADVTPGNQGTEISSPVINDGPGTSHEPPTSIDTSYTLEPTSGSEEVPTDVTVQGSQLSATEAPRRTYTPFRYSPGPRKEYNQSNVGGSSNKAYSDLRHDYNEGGRIFAGPAAPPLLRPGTTAPSGSDGDTDETFLGIVRARSIAYRKPVKSSKDVSASEATSHVNGDPPLGRIFSDLQSLLPKSLHHGTRAPLTDEIAAKVNTRKNDFGWIKEILKRWDDKMREPRLRTKEKRQERLRESESRVDEMVDENHSYLDRAAMELELKQIEAQKQLNEERREYEDYVEHVFKPVDARLTAEIASLAALEKKIADQFSSDARVNSSNHNISAPMGFLLTIFNKLETTHEERVRNNIDLERRRKQAERMFFVVLNDQASLKKLDKDFSKAERHAALNAATERNRRTNELMDVIDKMSSIGLGANQGLLDDILAKVNQILECREQFDASHKNPANGAVLKDAYAVVRYLGAESENIVQYFSVAEGNLNNSDYDLAMWQARVRGADQEAFAQLIREKQEEDRKLKANSKSRVADFQKEYGAAMNLVTRASAEVSDATAPNQSPMETPMDRPNESHASYRNSQAPDEETQERFRKALEEAKRRNAAKFGR
ncbi:hypothetical protein KEM56_006871 [Ascosphaera pollenicola]|nr:hypothetical protein KEM56_006871 [Ascosphaera pollenicola]